MIKLRLLRGRSLELPLWLVAGLIVLVSRLLLFAIYWYWKQQTGSDNGLFSSLMQWDCGWYSSIAENGYGSEATIHSDGQAPWAFFPLVPWLEGMLTRLTGLPIRVAGSLLNTCALYLITWLGGRYVLDLDSGPAQAMTFMLFVNFGPYNVYYSTLYTEAFFVLLTCLTLYCLQKQHWLLMGVFGALASATRNTGIFLVFAVPVWCIASYLRQSKAPARPSLSGFLRWIVQKPRLILGTFLMPMGFFLYMRFLTGLLGDGLAFMHVQYAWGRSVGNPLVILYNSLISIGSETFFQGVCTLVVLYLCVRQILRRRVEGVLSLLFLFIPLSTSVFGMTRYTLCSFPVLLEISDTLSRKNRLAQIFWSLFLLVFGIGTTLQWLMSSSVMM